MLNTIDLAQLKVFPYHQYYNAPTATTTWVDRVNAAWNATTLTWNNKPASTNIGSAALVEGQTGVFNVTSTVQAWADTNSNATNYGFKLHENGNGGTYWKRLIASEQGGANIPKLYVEYHRPTATASSPTGSAWTNSRTLTWLYSDDENLSQTKYQVQVATTSDFAAPIHDSNESNGTGQTYQIPGGVSLTNGTTYYWRVKVYNGSSWSLFTSAAAFNWDTTLPTWNGFTAPTSQHDQATSTYTATWNAASDTSGIDHYDVARESAAISSANTCGTTWTPLGSQSQSSTSYQLSGMVGSTCYRLSVRAVDHAGNASAYSNSSPILVDDSAAGAPTVTDNCPDQGACLRVGDAIYLRSDLAGSVTLTSTGSDAQSGILSSTFDTLSAPTGWTYSPGAVSGNPASKILTWSGTAGPTTLTITTKNGAGTDSASATMHLIPDTQAPTAEFTAPAGGSVTLQTATTFSVEWTEAESDSGSGTGSGVASRSIQRQKALVVTAGICTDVEWIDDGSPTTSASPLAVSDLTHGYCYRWVSSLTDNLDNSASYTSGVVLVGTVNPDIPEVAASGAGVYQPGANGMVFFNPAAEGPVALTATVPVLPLSGIACMAFGELSSSTGWTPNPNLPSCPEAAPYTQALAFGETAGTATIDVIAHAGEGGQSSPRTITLVPDAQAPVGSFSNGSPVSDTTTRQSADSFTVIWGEADAASPGLPASGVMSRSLQRQRGAIVTPGSCADVTWSDDGTATSTESPLVEDDLGDGYCYHWVLALTDNVGNASTGITSGSLLIDETAPTAVIQFPQEGGSISGTVTVTGLASDTNITQCTLDYGEGPTPGPWTAINSDCLPTTQTGPLGTWATDSMRGVYTLRLRVTDAVDHTTTVTSRVYVDNTDRGESYYTSVPFDLGGDWSLGVNVATGEASLDRGLFTVPSYGPPQALAISYNSADTSDAGRLGRGWSSNLTQYLSFESGFVVWHRADGGTVPFGQINGSWVAMTGHYETLAPLTGVGYRITDTDRSSLSFDSSGRLTTMTNSFGTSLTLSWGSSSATATDASGRHTNLALDSSGRITSATDSAGRDWSFGYTDGNLTLLTDPADHETELGYDASGRLASISRQRTIDDTPTTVTWGLTYDATGKAETVVDPIGGTSHAATFTYGTSYAAGETVVVRPRDAAGHVPASSATYELDASRRGWVVSLEEAASATQTWTTDFEYDANGNVTRESGQIDNADNHATTTWTYKSWGAVETQTDPYGIVTTYTYSNDEYHDLRLQVVSHTAGGQTVSQTTAYAYDAAHRVCREVANPTVDPATISCTSSLGSGNAADEDVEHRYTYNAHNLMETQTDPLGVVTQYEYDANGDQISVTRNYEQSGPHDSSTNVTTTYDYAPVWAGNVSSEWRPISTNPTVNTRTLYAYDPLGRGTLQTQAGDEDIAASGSWTNYDEFGTKIYTARSLCTLPPPGANCNAWTSLESTFWVPDALGHLTEQSDWTPATEVSGAVMATATYVPDLAGDVLFATDANGVTTETTFNALGQVKDQAIGGATTTHTFDGLSREIETTAPGSATASLTTERIYDAAGHLMSQSETDDAGTPADTSDDTVSTTTYEYDLLGRLTKTTAPEGEITTQSYDALGRVVTSTSGTSATDTVYDRAGNSTQTSDPYDPTANPPATKTYATTGYDELDRAISTTHSGVTTHVYFDVADNVVATVDADGVITRTFYNVRGNVTKTIVNCTNSGTMPPEDPLTCAGTGTSDSSTNLVTTNTYGPSGGLIRSDGVVAAVTTRTTYDGAGRVLSTIVDLDGLNLTTTYTYDDTGRQIKNTDPAGVVTATVYDENGRVCRSIANLTGLNPWALEHPCTDPIEGQTGTANLLTRYQYDQAGNKAIVTAPNGAVTHSLYDANGNLKSMTEYWVLNDVIQDERTTTYFYDGDGRQIRVMDPAGTSTSTAYDANGRVCREVANISAATLAELEVLTDKCNGTISGKTSSANIETRYEYDAAGNKIRVESPSPADGATPSSIVITLYAYDSNQRLCRVVENAASSLNLSALANPCTTAIASGKLVNVDTQYTYDDAGNMTSQLTVGDPPGDPSGTTSWTYDALGRPKTKIDPLGNVEDPDPDVESHTTHWTYDNAGNKASQIDPDDAKTFWFYDAAGRMCRRIAIAAGVDIETVDFPAQPCTDQTLTENATLDTRYVPDALGNPAGIIDLVAGRTIATTYDELSRPTGVTDSALQATTAYTYGTTIITRADPAGSHVFTLDPFGRQVSLADPLTETQDNFAWAYESTGAVGSMVDPTLNETTYSHDPLGRLTGIALSGSSACSSCLAYAYAYNAAGNRISSTRTIGTEETTTAYGYDALSRLLNYDPTGTEADQTYGWDATPDRTSITRGTTTTNVLYDEASRIKGDTEHNTTDLNGRVTKLPGSRESEVLVLAYDPLGRLTSADSSIAGVPTATYAYDPLDRLASITTDEEVSQVTTFAYVGLSNAVAQVTVASGSASTVTAYTTDLDGSPLMSFVVPTQGAIAPVFLGLDAHGDIVWTTNLGGALCDTATYDPFGNLDSGSIPAGLRWQGSWQDSTTALYYVVARWYDPASGRFLSEDPLTADAATPQRRDPYPYAAGDPIRYADPNGRCYYDTNTHTFSGSDCPPAATPTPSGPGCDGGRPCEALLNQASIRHIWEKEHWSKICGAGALRIVIAFTNFTKYDHPAKWGPGGEYSGYGYKDSQIHKYPWNPSDSHGQNYMMYLALEVQPPGSSHKGIVTTGANGVTTTVLDLVYALNYVTTGTASFDYPFWYMTSWIKGVRNDHSTSDHFIENNNAHKLAFYRDIETEIAVYRMPAAVATIMNILPSQQRHKGAGGHWISVMGYDRDYFYYYDTCPGHTGCGFPTPRDSASTGTAPGAYGGKSKYQYLWRIAKSRLWTYLTDYVKDRGRYADFVLGW
jgi:RHS repeat-associated protein